MSPSVKYHYGKFPPTIIDWPQLIPLIGPASAALARYDGTLSAIPNAAILLSPLTTQEAVLSSKIEGTQATMQEVLEFEAEDQSKNISSERKADINEVLNYRRAMWYAVELLQELPLCLRVIKGAHRVLLDGVRGYGKSPGEYRRVPNWIGPPGCQMEDAKFVPISADRLPNAMNAFERYIHEDAPDRLVQLAIIHAEFEALHPFLDGNGRLGRMCVPLFMYKKGLIHSPMFYISAFFERNRDEYYERLLAISRDDNWTGWCKFFLQAIEAQAHENLEKASEILKLYEAKKTQVVEITHSQYAIHTLDYIFSRPIFKSTDFTGNTEVPEPTAKRILKLLRDNGILITFREGSGRRAAIYAFKELLNVAEGEKVF
ncbi:MAG: Fic family protein [Desulfobulbaceae bacterium]|nr:Fic family protein [Desulfobulbaceae bacterium]